MKISILIVFGLLLTEIINAQSRIINLNKEVKNDFEVKSSPKRVDTLEIKMNLSYLSSNLTTTELGDFIMLESDGLVKTFELGKPNIPLFSKLIELPLEASVDYKILSYDEIIIDLNEIGITQKIIPAQPSISKSIDENKFYFDERTYLSDNYFNTTIVKFEDIGILRSTRLGRIIVSPIQYNPVKNKLRILNDLKIEVAFNGSNHAKTQKLKSKYNSNIFNEMINGYTQNTSLNNKSVITESITYVIISDRRFESTISSFISHKQNFLGYNVIVGYTDDPNVGKTTNSIKAYLENLYNNPPSGYNPPHYVLLVGDVWQIPSFPSNGHITDLYYFDYTNDNIPDVFYGRFSANNTTQLIPQIEKTIEYELSLMPDPSYLFETVLIAGDDSTKELTYGNGQLNYATTEYFNSDNGINAHAYYQDEPIGGNYSSQIISDINNGVGFVNYTGHGVSTGWSNPKLKISDFSSLTNTNKYGLWVGNCCLSNKFNDYECFGEAVLRASNKGAVGYIGATDYTYWDEDFWWTVGFKTITSNPLYDASHLGAFDRLFHTNGESTNEWYSTQGQLLIGGNLAVQESNSNRKLYYWEIYHLMGDPSLNIHFLPPCRNDFTINTNISGGQYEYLASNQITASNKITNSANVHYGANNAITLSSGFNVQLGSIFSADLNGCTDSNYIQSTTIIADTLNNMNITNLIPLKATEGFNEEFIINTYQDTESNDRSIIEILELNPIPESIILYNSFGSIIHQSHDLNEKLLINDISEKGEIFIRFIYKDRSIIKKIILK